MRLPFKSREEAVTPIIVATGSEGSRSTNSADGKETKGTADAQPTDVDIDQARADLEAIQRNHEWDPNLPPEKLEQVKKALADNDATEILEADELFADNSPYDSVRAAVRNTDGGEYASTVRAWVLGMIFVTIGSGLNMFLSMRSPAINFPSLVVQLLVYPLGRLWAAYMPTRVFNTFGISWTLNPGPFSIKEHVVITLMSNVSIGYAYSTDALLALQGKPFYDINLGWGFQLLFTLSSQLIGIGLAGLARRFLVWPAAMIWPNQFSNTVLFYALHDKTKKGDEASANGWSISRFRYFTYCALGMFCYYWIPGVLFQGMSVFAFITWIRPNDVVVNQLFGGFTGLSLIPITFDWTYVTGYLNDPLLSPVPTLVSVLIGLIIFAIIPIIGIVYSGLLYSEYLPVVTSTAYDNTGSTYNVSRILGDGYVFDVDKYKAYSPLLLTPAYVLNFGLSFAALTASIVHTIVFHGKEIWYRLKTARNQEADIHLKMMRKYLEVPDWWYLALFLVSVGLGFATTQGYGSQLPWWAFIVSILLAVVFMIPTCTILAISNIPLALNILSPFLAGFMIPGRPIGVMTFKVYSVIVLGQAQTFAGDLKLGHYMKIPPRITFWCQVVATIWATFVQIAVMNWTLGTIPDVCTSLQPAHFSCPNGRAFFTLSIVWGVIGPSRMFGAGSLYGMFNVFWLIGAVMPIVFYFLTKYWSPKIMRFLNAPVILGSLGWLPPATPISFSTWAITGLIFNHYLRNKFPSWWFRYNYLTAAGLDAGLIIGTVVIFFAITFPSVTIPQWFGNVDVFNTLDASYSAVLKTVGENETFGPTTW